MTIATTTGNELTIDGIVRTAHVLSGLLSQYQSLDAARAATGRLLLDSILKELENEGIYARSAKFELVTIVSGTFKYTMPTDCLDLFGTAMWISADQASTPDAASELPVNDITRDRWQRLQPKNSTGRPIYYYPHRELFPIEAWLWPIPDASSDGSLLRFQTHRLRSDATDGAKTVDYEVYWTQFFIWELSHQLSVASQKPLARCQYLAGQASMKKAKAKTYSAQRPEIQFTVGYPRQRGAR